MRTFEYKGYQSTGKGCTGLVEALDLKDAREKLARQGILVDRLGRPGGGRTRRRNNFTTESRCTVYRELGSLLRSGLPLSQALDVLIEAPELGDARTVLASVRDRIHEGVSPADALGGAAARVSAFERAVLVMGEQTGELAGAVDQLADFLEEEEAIRQGVRTALIYPLLVVLLAVGLAIVTQAVMIPGMSRLLSEARVELPALTRWMMAMNRVALIMGLPLIAAGCGVGVFLRRRWKNESGFRIRIDRLLFRAPLWRTGYTALVNMRFSRILSLLVEGGVPLVEGVDLAGRATGSPWVEDLVSREAEGLRHGRSVAEVLRRIPPLSASLPGWVEVGETGGALREMLAGAAARYRQQWERWVRRFLALLEPALLLAVGLFVLLVALAVLMPVLSMNSQL